VLNFSIGGPDWADRPFLEKIREAAAAGVVVVSAIGNDGPVWGTLNNPADMPEVVGVGAVSSDGTKVARFSSRGMSTWELNRDGGYGRFKPDLVALGVRVKGVGRDAAAPCRLLSGTSVASPVVAGLAALLASVALARGRPDLVNVASLKQVLVEPAVRLDPTFSVYAQGAGAYNVTVGYRRSFNTKWACRSRCLSAHLPLPSSRRLAWPPWRRSSPKCRSSRPRST